MRGPTPSRPRRGVTCEACGCGLAGQGAILVDGPRRLFLCRPCMEDTWARRDAADEIQRQILEQAWRLAPWQGNAGADEAIT